MTEFDPSVFLSGDRAGQGRWEVGHYRQHLHYLSHLAALAVPVQVPDHPLLVIGKTNLERRVWLQDHAQIHNLMRTYANVTGIDLSAVDFDDEEQFSVWLDSHATEHELIDAAFGL